MHTLEQSRATAISFPCFAMKAGSATPTRSRGLTETSVMTMVSLFVLVLLAVLLFIRCLTGLIHLHRLVGLTTQRASAAGQGV